MGRRGCAALAMPLIIFPYASPNGHVGSRIMG